MDYDVLDIQISEKRARSIIQKISDAAIELAVIRHSLTTEEFELDETFMDEIKKDVLEVLTGDETGCLLPRRNSTTPTVVRLWLQEKAFREEL